MDRTAKVGLGPGSLIHVGTARTEPVSIHLMNYSPTAFSEHTVRSVEEIGAFINSDGITWINIDGIHDPNVVERIGNFFGIHVLMLEDIMNSTSRPKVELGENYMFITLKMLETSGSESQIHLEQFSIIAGKNYLITFQELKGDPFDAIRDNIRTARGQVRHKNAHYLAYLLLDVIVDNYITISEKYADDIEQLEKQVLRRPNELVLYRILSLRKELLSFKRSIDPLKEVVNFIQKEVDKNTNKYYRDLHDHIISESENLAVYREMLANLLDLYHSGQSYKMNNVMKVLTIITTIFVPLTFIVGVYGMNFRYMPELEWHYGYFGVLAAMGLLVVGMLIYFRRKKWL